MRQKHLKNIPKDDPYISRFVQSKFKGRSNHVNLPVLINCVCEVIKFCETSTSRKEEVEVKTSSLLERLADFPFFFEQ